MPVALTLLIQRTEAALAAATDPKKKLRLERDIASYKLTAVRAESDEPDDDDDDEPEGDDDKASKAAKRAEASKRKLEAAKHKAKADDHRAKAAECDEAARKAMGDEGDDEDEEAKAMRAELIARKASLSDGAAAALASQAGHDARMQAQLDAMVAERTAEKMQASIDAALTGRRVTPGEAKTLATKAPAFVADFLAMRPKAIVNTDDSTLSQPDQRQNADLDPKALTEIDGMVAKLPNLTDGQRAEVKLKMIDGRRALLNGAPLGRY